MPSPVRRFQTAAAIAGGAGLLLGFLASIGLRLLPLMARPGLWVAAGTLLALGVAGGVATVARGREIERTRWELVDDPLMTSGERELAHKEAERERRWAGTVFFTAPVGLAYWAANQLVPEAVVVAPPLLALVPLAGYLAGLLAAHAAGRARRAG